MNSRISFFVIANLPAAGRRSEESFSEILIKKDSSLHYISLEITRRVSPKHKMPFAMQQTAES